MAESSSRLRYGQCAVIGLSRPSGHLPGNLPVAIPVGVYLVIWSREGSSPLEVGESRACKVFSRPICLITFKDEDQKHKASRYEDVLERGMNLIN